MNHNIIVYTSALCSLCFMVKDFLITSHFSFQEVNVNLNPIARAKLIGKTKKLTVSRTNINREWISGFDPVRMLEAMQI